MGVFTGTGGVYAYCIQKGTVFYSGDRTGVAHDNSNAFGELSEEAQTGIKLAMLYGFPNRSRSTLGADHADDAYVAIQAIVSEYQLSFRTSPSSRISSPKTGRFHSDYNVLTLQTKQQALFLFGATLLMKIVGLIAVIVLVGSVKVRTVKKPFSSITVNDISEVVDGYDVSLTPQVYICDIEWLLRGNSFAFKRIYKKSLDCDVNVMVYNYSQGG